jgi:microcystin-dependent protein
MTVVRPLRLPDTTSQAGFENLDPISMWFLGGTATAGAQATGINDDDRYGLELLNIGAGGLSFKATSGNGLHQIKVDNTGVTISGTVSGILVGEIRTYGGATAPAGFLVCNGSAVSRTTYAALFAAIGTGWGAGDGSTTFNVPNLAGRMLMGSGGGFTVGQTGGSAAGYPHTHGPGDLSLPHKHAHSHTLVDHDHGEGDYHTHAQETGGDLGGPQNDLASVSPEEADAANDGHSHQVPSMEIHGESGSAHKVSDGADFTSTESADTSITSTQAPSGDTDDADYVGSDFRPPYAVVTAIIYSGI